MGFISEIHYRTSDVNVADSATHEFVEITLAPGEDPADFVLSFYGRDGALMDDAGDNIEATGVSDGEVTLSSLTGVPDPENPGYTIYTVTGTSAVHELINASSSQVADEANYVALTNTATGVVESAIGIGSNRPIELSGGAADTFMTINAPRVGSGQSVQFDSNGNNVSGPRTPGNSDVVCFCQGTLISVPGGTCAVEDLKVGDEVDTLNFGAQRIRWIGRTPVSGAQFLKNPKLRPIRISRGSMGHGLPQRDLLVSRQHRMLASSQITQRLFGQSTSLVAAVKLTLMPGIFIDTDVTEVVYFHILFDQHAVIFAENAPTESLFLGKHTLRTLDRRALKEVYALFPDLVQKELHETSAAYVPSNRDQRNLTALHAQNKSFLLDEAWRKKQMHRPHG